MTNKILPPGDLWVRFREQVPEGHHVVVPPAVFWPRFKAHLQALRAEATATGEVREADVVLHEGRIAACGMLTTPDPDGERLSTPGTRAFLNEGGILTFDPRRRGQVEVHLCDGRYRVEDTQAPSHDPARVQRLGELVAGVVR